MDTRRLPRPTSRARQTSATLTLAIALAGCLGSPVALIDEPAPLFFLQDTTGQAHYLERYDGSTLILDFFSTWCLPCREQFRELAAMEANANASIVSIGTDPSETPEEIEAFAREHDATWPIAQDTDGLTVKAGIRALPGIVIIDPTGALRFRHEGTAIDAATLSDVLERTRRT